MAARVHWDNMARSVHIGAEKVTESFGEYWAAPFED